MARLKPNVTVAPKDRSRIVTRDGDDDVDDDGRAWRRRRSNRTEHKEASNVAGLDGEIGSIVLPSIVT